MWTKWHVFSYSYPAVGPRLDSCSRAWRERTKFWVTYLMKSNGLFPPKNSSIKPILCHGLELTHNVIPSGNRNQRHAYALDPPYPHCSLPLPWIRSLFIARSAPASPYFHQSTCLDLWTWFQVQLSSGAKMPCPQENVYCTILNDIEKIVLQQHKLRRLKYHSKT